MYIFHFGKINLSTTISDHAEGNQLGILLGFALLCSALLCFTGHESDALPTLGLEPLPALPREPCHCQSLSPYCTHFWVSGDCLLSSLAKCPFQNPLSRLHLNSLTPRPFSVVVIFFNIYLGSYFGSRLLKL